MLERGQLFVFHRAVAGPKVNGSSRDLGDAATATDRLVVDFDVRMLLMILIKPFGINGIRESGACAIELGLRERWQREQNQCEYWEVSSQDILL